MSVGSGDVADIGFNESSVWERLAAADRSCLPNDGDYQDRSVRACRSNLKDVLDRLPTKPATRIDELLPHRWQVPATAGRLGQNAP
jgi:hypothetical protein